MPWKNFTVLATLIIMVITISPAKVKAQSLAEVSLGLGMVIFGVGEGETAQIQFAPRNHSRGPQSQEDPLVGFHFRIEIQGVIDGSCRQTFEKTLLQSTIFGLPMLNISKGFGFVTIDDGKDVEEHVLDPCFGDGRIAVLVGVPVPPDRVADVVAKPNTVPIGVQVPKAAWYTITGPNGKARASSASLRLGYILSQDVF